MTFFDSDKELELAQGMNFTELQVFLDDNLPTENIFYAIKISGTFSYMKTRSVPGQQKPYPPLVEVTANQPVFELNDVKGTIVGFRSPPYAAGVNVPGYHLHFLTEDASAGGHILDFTVEKATAFIDNTSGFYMVLPGEGSDFITLTFPGQTGRAGTGGKIGLSNNQDTITKPPHTGDTEHLSPKGKRCRTGSQ